MAAKSTSKPELALVEKTEAAASGTDAAAPALTPADQALGAVEAALAAIAEEQRPMVRRGELLAQRLAQQAREIETLLEELNGREALLERVVEAARLALGEQRSDLEEELALVQHGLVGGATHPKDSAQ